MSDEAQLELIAKEKAADEAVKLAAELKAQQEQNAQLRADAAKREADEAAAAEAKRLKALGADEVRAQLEKERAENAQLRQEKIERQEAAIAALPKEHQGLVAMAAPEKRDAMIVELQKQAAERASSVISSTRSTGDVGANGPSDAPSRFRFQPFAREILTEHGPEGFDPDKMEKTLHVSTERDPETGIAVKKYGPGSVRQMQALMHKQQPQMITLRSITARNAD